MTDTLHHTVKVFDSVGNYLFRIGKGGSGPDDLDRPRYVIVKDETVIISDYRNNRLKIHNTQGELIGIVDRIGGDHLLNPEGYGSMGMVIFGSPIPVIIGWSNWI